MTKEEGIKTPNIEDGWLELLREEFSRDYFRDLKSFLLSEKSSGKVIYPSGAEIFNSFNYTPFKELKVVILGQDPYHGPQQAQGLCFSVRKGITPPPSLVNIFKELEQDCGIKPPGHGDLTHWAKEGVLLMNAILTVRRNEPASHREKGWEVFTARVIKSISDHKEGIVFLLWGKFAQSKEPLIDATKHFVLKAAHPSPFSAYNGFFGCRHFSRTNEILKSQGIKPVNWNLSR